MPPQSQANRLSLFEIPIELKTLCPLESQLISRIIPFMKIVSLPIGSQRGIKVQVVLVPTDLSKIAPALPRSTNDFQFITLSWRRRLTDLMRSESNYSTYVCQ